MIGRFGIPNSGTPKEKEKEKEKDHLSTGTHASSSSSPMTGSTGDHHEKSMGFSMGGLGGLSKMGKGMTKGVMAVGDASWKVTSGAASTAVSLGGAVTGSSGGY